MTEKTVGGSAFPVCFEGGGNNGESPFFSEGMGLRDYIATAAMAAALTTASAGNESNLPEMFRMIANMSYMAADAMIEERSK